MKILKSHRDHYFLRWNEDDLMQWGRLSNTSSFDYVSVDQMQRGDVISTLLQRGDITAKSKEWLTQNQEQNKSLREHIAKTIDEEGMNNPLILVSVNHQHWKSVDNYFWKSIPFVIQTGNNRYQYAMENNYTHISSILLGATISPRVWNFMQKELKKPLGETIKITKENIYRSQAERI